MSVTSFSNAHFTVIAGNSIGSGTRLFFVFGWIPAAYKYNLDMGGLYHNFVAPIGPSHTQAHTWKIEFPFKPFR